MKTTAQLPSDASAPEVVLSEARKRAAFNALRQRYEAHEQATGTKSAEAFAQLQTEGCSMTPIACGANATGTAVTSSTASGTCTPSGTC